MPKSLRGKETSALRGNHFYTTSPAERDRAALDGYKYECIAGYLFDSPMQQTIPLYRLFNPEVHRHLYTTSAAERDESVAKNGYRDEGIAGFVFDSPTEGAAPLYRLFHAGTFDHLYTTKAAERDESVVQNGYRDEGIAGYVLVLDCKGASPLYRLYNIVASGEMIRITLSNIRFDYEQAVVGPTEVQHQISQNLINETNVEQDTKFAGELKYSETKKWSTEMGVKMNIETTIQSGLPLLVEGKIKVGAEVSASLSWGEELTEEKTYSYEVPTKVPPHSKVICRATVSKAKLVVPYIADAVYHFSGGQEVRGRFAGTLTSEMAHEFQASWGTPSPTE